MQTLNVKLLPHAFHAPEYATEGSAGMDFYSADEVMIEPGELKEIRTGICLEVPPGHELQMRSRSGLARKHRLFVLNSPGTVDSDYRGEVVILLFNLSQESYFVLRGERVAQGVLARVERAEVAVVELLSETARGTGGFGSTGR